MTYASRALILLLLLSLITLAGVAWAGPPFATDDPDPVEYHHWEVYSGYARSDDRGEMNGALPFLEMNYGPVKNIQLSLTVPYAFDHESGKTERGLGDVEIGVKYRFIQETKTRPMVAFYPSVDLPMGDSNKNLGAGHELTFLPIWLQKSWGKWTTYGGGGYWFTPGTGNKNYWFTGLAVEREINEHWMLGGEIFHMTADSVGESGELNFNLGGEYTFDEGHHIVFSGGFSLQGERESQVYVAYKWMFPK